MSNVGDFPGVEFLTILNRDFKKRKKNLLLMFASYIKRRTGRFHVVVAHWTSKKCTTKRDARAVVLVIKPIAFPRCRCRRRCRRGCLSPKAFLREARQPEVRTFPF